jgi:hypothetical protein
MLDKFWIVQNFPLLVTTVAVAVGLTEEQIKLQIVSGATTACVMMLLWVCLKLFIWLISTVGVTKIAGVFAKHAVLSIVGVLSAYLAWEYCTISNILWAYYTSRTYLMKYGVIPQTPVSPEMMFD